MRKGTKKSENLTLYDLLTADYYDENIKIKDTSYDNSHELIPSRKIFFEEEGLFVHPEHNSLIAISGENKRSIDLDELLRKLQLSESTSIVFIEGFAGCGKSTLVQYILSKQLHSYSFDHDLYNYNLEAKNDINTHDESGQKIKESSIFSAIINCFIEEFSKTSIEHPEVITDFNQLLEFCEKYQPFSNLYHRLYNTETFKNIIDEINNGKNTSKIKSLLMKQIQWVKSLSMCILALDYLLRLSMYKHRLIEDLYICYDNLDAIEDAHDLAGFDDKLFQFKGLIDDFIDFAYNKNFFYNQATPHFIILTTYRKITASLADIESTYREVACDNYGDTEQAKNVWYIDATTAFSYKKIVAKRKNYFIKHLSGNLGMSDEKIKELKNNLSSWETLNSSLVIMNDRYSGLWNKNYRTCSLIANELFAEVEYNFENCIQFIKKEYFPDGYEESADDKGENILCSYFGGSAIILSNVCKIFHNKNIWNEFLDLANLDSDKISYKNVSLARLILTYIHNSNEPVSLEKLYVEFCNKNLFSYKQLCKILSKMLARNPDGFWRRPIYYANKCILAEDAQAIESILLAECEQFRDTNRMSQNYTFLLCDSGKAYVENLMSEFEFFSNRLSNQNSCLYLYESVEDIENIIKNVFSAVATCCENILLFGKKYITDYKITKEKYLTLRFHPTTNRQSPQLHIERTIFSHIAYLNNVRLYFIDERITKDIEERKKYNAMFVNYICKYLTLYFKKIMPICQSRKSVYEKLMKKTVEIQSEIKKGGNNLKILFESISL